MVEAGACVIMSVPCRVKCSFCCLRDCEFVVRFMCDTSVSHTPLPAVISRQRFRPGTCTWHTRCKWNSPSTRPDSSGMQCAMPIMARHMLMGFAHAAIAHATLLGPHWAGLVYIQMANVLQLAPSCISTVDPSLMKTMPATDASHDCVVDLDPTQDPLTIGTSTWSSRSCH